MSWHSENTKAPNSSNQNPDDVRDQNTFNPTVPQTNWDGSNKGSTPLLGVRDPKQVA
jgi:hypothetical protein